MARHLTLGYVAAQNLRRQPGRSLAALAGVMLATATLLTISLGYWGARRSAELGFERLGADMVVVPHSEGPRASPEALVLAGQTEGFLDPGLEPFLRTVRGVEAISPQLYIPGVPSPLTGSGQVRIVGIDPATDFTVTPWLATPLAQPLPDDAALVGAGVQATPGEHISLFGRSFRVAGQLHQAGTELDEAVILTLTAARNLSQAPGPPAPPAIPAEAVSALLCRTVDWMPPPLISTQIQSRFPEVDVFHRDVVADSVAQNFTRVMRWIIWAAAAALGTALLLVGVLFTAIVTERQRELGLLRAMGATFGDIVRLILTEAVMLTTTGGVAGVILGGLAFFLVRSYLAQALRVPSVVPPALESAVVAVGALIVAALAGLAAAAYPALQAALMEPYAAIRRGE